MARPSPTILLEHVNSSTYRAQQILRADLIVAVLYKGQPINVRTLHTLIDYPGPKYSKTSFANPGHAFNLADKLNAMFKTNEFTVHAMTVGDELVDPAMDS